MELKYTGTGRQGFRLIVSLLLFALLLQPGFAAAAEDGAGSAKVSVDLLGHTEGYSAVLYDGLNGLPTSEANAIV